MRVSGVAALLLALLLPAAASVAHTRSTSHSSWELDEDGARVRVRIALLELTRLPPERVASDPSRIASYLSERLQLWAGDEVCALSGPPARQPAPEGFAVYAWRLRCGPGARTITSHLLLDVAPSHLHFARLRGAEGSVRERVLVRDDARWSLGAAEEESSGTSFGGYLRIGIAHILTGWDHLAFLVGLLLLARSLGEVAGLVTSFTIAHSVTLGLAVLGLVHPDRAAVEALIGFSIALVAVENGWLLSGRRPRLPSAIVLALLALTGLAALGVGTVPPAALLGITVFTACHFALLKRAARPARLRVAVAFGFGLIHGFGFAGLLAELELPTERLVPALLGFNLGVELGQLALVVAVWPLLRLVSGLGERVRLETRMAEVGSAAICGLGTFWFAQRLFA